MKSIRLFIILAIAVLLLSCPFIAMQFTNEFNWTATDFIVMGILLFGTGLACEFVMRKEKCVKSRIIICGAILFMIFLVWAELAVGIFGTPFAGS